MKKKVAFLFGAGAEAGHDNFKQLTGVKYFKTTIIDEQPAILAALQKIFDKKYFESCEYRREIVYEKNKSEKKIILDMLRLYLEDSYWDKGDDNYQDLLECLKEYDFNLSSEYVTNLITELFPSVKKKKVKEKWQNLTGKDELVINDENEARIINEFNEILQGNSPDNLSELMTVLTKEDKCERKLIYPITVAGFFEKHFHTIIDPKKYGRYNFMKIFNYYWIAYFSIVNGIIELLRPYANEFNESQQLFLHTDDIIRYQEILANITEFTKFLYSKEVKNIIRTISQDSYYSWLKTRLADDKNFKCSGVLTANYFNYVEIVDDNVAYLNGALKLFEFPELIDVIDLSLKDYSIENDEERKDKLFFPFIFGQSMLKPIVSRQQIEAFNQAITILDDTDYLVILGYNLNEDDNHINSLLRDFLKRDQCKIILMGDFNEEEVKTKLKLRKTEKLVKVDFDYNDINPQMAVTQLFEKLENI